METDIGRGGDGEKHSDGRSEKSKLELEIMTGIEMADLEMDRKQSSDTVPIYLMFAMSFKQYICVYLCTSSCSAQ